MRLSLACSYQKSLRVWEWFNIEVGYFVGSPFKLCFLCPQIWALLSEKMSQVSLKFVIYLLHHLLSVIFIHAVLLYKYFSKEIKRTWTKENILEKLYSKINLTSSFITKLISYMKKEKKNTHSFFGFFLFRIAIIVIFWKENIFLSFPNSDEFRNYKQIITMPIYWSVDQICESFDSSYFRSCVIGKTKLT